MSGVEAEIDAWGKRKARKATIFQARSTKGYSRIASQGFRETIDIGIIPGIFFDDDRLSFESSFQIGGDFVVQTYKAYHRL
jgi:hypothetical protein